MKLRKELEGVTMAIRYLKEGKSALERSEDDAKVRQIVETTLSDIEARGDAAVRELAEKFDNYSPPSYRLSESEIQALISEVKVHNVTALLSMEEIKSTVQLPLGDINFAGIR